MSTFSGFSDAVSQVNRSDESELAKMEQRLPPLLSVIAGMVDLTGFFTLGSIFTAHVTGNLVLAAAAAVHGGPWNLAQALAIPVFILAVAAAWLIARASNLRGVDPGDCHQQTRAQRPQVSCAICPCLFLRNCLIGNS